MTRGAVAPLVCMLKRPCSAPDPAGGAHDASPDVLIGWGGDTPSPFPWPLAACGASILMPGVRRTECDAICGPLLGRRAA